MDAANMFNGKEFVVFYLGNKFYGFETSTLKEIRRYQEPKIEEHQQKNTKGTLNLRGEVLLVVDLHQLIVGGDSLTFDRSKCILVVSLGNNLVGVVVDGVSDFLLIPESVQHGETKEEASRQRASYLRAVKVAKFEEITIIDIKALADCFEILVDNKNAHLP